MYAQSDPGAGGLWKNADFIRLFGATGVSAFGARISREGLPLMAVMLLHASPREIGVLAAFRAAPALLVGPLCGRWVDRARRRRILIGADLARAAVLLAIPAAAVTHHLQMALVCLVGAAVGGLSSLFDMADHAYLPALVERDALLRANSALGAVESTAEIGGPALAGLLFSTLTAPLAIAVNSLTYLASAAALAAIREAEPLPVPDDDPAGAAGPGGGWLEGLAIAWRTAEIRTLLLLIATFGLFGSFFSALYIPFAMDSLGLTPAMLGATIAVGGVGALAGAALAPRLGRVLGVGGALIATGFLYAAFTGIIPLAGGPPIRGMAVLMAAQLLGDTAGTAMYIYEGSLRQTLLPQNVLGRVAGVFAAAGGLAAILGALAGGALSGIIGVRAAMAIACLGMAAAPLWRLKLK